jgi:hypothetical protein
MVDGDAYGFLFGGDHVSRPDTLRNTQIDVAISDGDSDQLTLICDRTNQTTTDLRRQVSADVKISNAFSQYDIHVVDSGGPNFPVIHLDPNIDINRHLNNRVDGAKYGRCAHGTHSQPTLFDLKIMFDHTCWGPHHQIDLDLVSLGHLNRTIAHT